MSGVVDSGREIGHRTIDANDPKPTFMAEPAPFNQHAAADLAGEGFERLRVMPGRSNQAFPGPLCVGAGRS
jgi:hypothetical protein